MYDEGDDDEESDKKIKKFMQKPELKIVHFTSGFERNSTIYKVNFHNFSYKVKIFDVQF
jgi:hypothetical protein